MPASVERTFENHSFESPLEEQLKILELSRPYLRAGLRVLDIGCGNGDYLAILDKQGFPSRGLGIDISAQNIQRAKELHPLPSLSFVQGNYYETALKENFQVILSNSALQYQPIRLDKIKNDLEKNGLLLLYTPIDNFSNRLKNSLRTLVKLLPQAWTDKIALTLMKRLYGKKWAEEELKNRLVYLRAKAYFLMGKKEIRRFQQLGLELDKAHYFSAIRSFWQLQHGFFVFKNS